MYIAATAAGIGGGGLFVPLYAFVLGFQKFDEIPIFSKCEISDELGVGAKGAVPLSKSTIFGGALGKYLVSSQV